LTVPYEFDRSSDALDLLSLLFYLASLFFIFSTMSKKELELNVTQVPKTAEEQKLTLNPYVPLYIAKAPWYELLNKVFK
jgi:hypothetical protein